MAQFRAGVANARASIDQISASIAQDRNDLRRTETLVKQNLASDSDLDKAQTLVKVDEGRLAAQKQLVAQNQGQLETALYNLSRATLTALIDGTILDKPIHDRYQVRHDFLTPELGDEVITISRLVNAFFRWEFNSCETIVKDGIAYPIDYANASPDVALTSLHYYFPWAIKALVRWSAYCAATRRTMHVNQNSRAYFEWGDRDDLSYEQKLAKYRDLADDYFEIDAYREFCAKHLGHLDELAHEWFTSQEFDDVLVHTVTSTFPAHEHEHFVAHYRGLLAVWAHDDA